MASGVLFPVCFAHSVVTQALALEFGERADASHDGSLADNSNSLDSTFYEITIATVDQPKLLSRLSDAMVSCHSRSSSSSTVLWQ